MKFIYLHGDVILHVVLQMVWVVDTRQMLIVVIVSNELSFLGKVGSLLCKHIAERIISETCNAACRMVHLCTAVTHVVSECGNRKSADISKFGNMVYDISFHMRIFSI